MSTEDDRRATNRITYRAHCTMYTQFDAIPAHLLNLSEHGALIAVLEEKDFEVGIRISLSIDVGNKETATLKGTIAHVRNHFLGLECQPRSDEDIAKLNDIVNRGEPPSIDDL